MPKRTRDLSNEDREWVLRGRDAVIERDSIRGRAMIQAEIDYRNANNKVMMWYYFLSETDLNKSAVARIMGISSPLLHYRMKTAIEYIKENTEEVTTMTP